MDTFPVEIAIMLGALLFGLLLFIISILQEDV